MQRADERLEDIATLARSALLTSLSTEEIGALLALLEVVGVPEGSVLAREGEPGDGVCFLLEGTARAVRKGVDLGSLVPGDTFGELTLVPPGAQMRTVIATTPLRVARLTRAAFESLGRANASVALHVAKALLHGFAEDLVRTTESSATRLRDRPSLRSEVTTRLADRESTVPTGVRVGDLLPKEIDGVLVVAALVDHRTVRLDAALTTDSTVAPVTLRTWGGREVFRRSAGIVVLEAGHKIGAPPLRLGPSLTTGRVVYVEGSHDGNALAAMLNERVAALVEQDAIIREELWNVDEATAYFDAHGWTDASALLEFWDEPGILVASCGELYALAPGPMLPTTGLLAGVEVYPHPHGLLLDYGPRIRKELDPRPFSTRMMEVSSPRFGGEMTRTQKEWLELLGVTSVGAFNRACVSGQVKELIHVSEGFHEKHIAQTADDVKKRGAVRIIAIAGPSSSGKTTFIKRLKIQLEVNGIHPIELSLDDYYLDRERVPRDAAGEHDFEALGALDLQLLDTHVTGLLAGSTVRSARYDFRTGRGVPDGGRELQLGASHVLLVEGIHALNPLLFTSAQDDTIFRIFVHPATALPFDRLAQFEPADVRLLRRIVRDRHQRGFAAADNLARWSSVRRGERLHIYPHQPNADRVFDSSLVYEVSVLRVYAERYLLEVQRSHPEYASAYRLRRLLDPFVPIHPDHVPPTSILREFIGGSGFSY